MTARRYRAAVLVALTGFAALVAADSAQAACSPAVTAADRDTQGRAQATVPALLNHGFDAAGHEKYGFGVTIELPRLIAPDCPPSRETVFNLSKTRDGRLRGEILLNFLSENTDIFGTEVSFHPDAIIDWTFVDLSTFPPPRYGLFAERPATDDGRMLYGLADTDVPLDWNERLVGPTQMKSD